MSPLIVLAIIAVVWIAAAVLWFADAPDPRSNVDMILQEVQQQLAEEPLAA